MTQQPNLFAALAAPFDQTELKVRSTAGRQLHYITARTVMNRLDEVLGPENWYDRYVPGENSVLCELTIRMPDGSTLTKCDAGGYAGMADSGDDDKSGYSDAFKRAAVKFGVARYLYRDGVASYAGSEKSLPGPAPTPSPTPAPSPTNGRTNGHTNGKPRTEWQDKGPGTAGVASKATAPAQETRAPDNRRRRGADGPETGGQLYAWACQTQRQRGRQDGLALVPYLNGWAKSRGFPGRMVDWTRDQVAEGYAEACRQLDESSR